MEETENDMLKKENLIKYIRDNDPDYRTVKLESHSIESLVLIKVRLELEKSGSDSLPEKNWLFLNKRQENNFVVYFFLPNSSSSLSKSILS